MKQTAGGTRECFQPTLAILLNTLRFIVTIHPKYAPLPRVNKSVCVAFPEASLLQLFYSKRAGLINLEDICKVHECQQNSVLTR